MASLLRKFLCEAERNDVAQATGMFDGLERVLDFLLCKHGGRVFSFACETSLRAARAPLNTRLARGPIAWKTVRSIES